MGPGFGPPLGNDVNEKLKPPRPKNLREVPGYLRTLFSTFFTRLFYIVKLVWEAKPSLLFLMVFMTVFNGIMPVVGAKISANLLTAVAGAIVYLAKNGSSIAFSAIFFPLLLQFGYLLFNSLVNSVNNIITNISQEVVTNHIKVKIMKKAKEIDLASFDMPDFYERLENANREAGMRPINVLNATFRIITCLITIISFIVVLCGVAFRTLIGRIPAY